MVFHCISADGKDRLFCGDAVCRGHSLASLVASESSGNDARIAVVGKEGVGVADTDSGLVWSRLTVTGVNPNGWTPCHAVASSDGRRIAFGVWWGSTLADELFHFLKRYRDSGGSSREYDGPWDSGPKAAVGDSAVDDFEDARFS